ncbi:phosphatidylglycerol lysyltransferase [Cohaesibacter marisflavi]|uniref:Phosphatidylglycerol lysyltransferase n=1 Tax=Cohaesibacter marisflavi TaxID=655353 RepID=A0A1I5JUP0_9HYPH|nr:bifunctional lysylphosphatidylglycerol flippase/synthetase MprF [Cohaesibacter marisflavi]SFO76497.1 phosphatidylglycerol lysyltransferase [Cohaesibacter marisflavi]
MSSSNSDSLAQSDWASYARKTAPILLALVLFVLGVYALYHLLKPVKAADVIAQVRMTPWWTLLSALLATAAGYVALIGYDWSALRSLGKKVPANAIAVGGFLGYSFGNTIGVSVISGGAVRYRVYSAFGLSLFEIASVSTFAALAFGFGITVIGLAALAIHPYALVNILPIAPDSLRVWAGVAAVAVVLLLLLMSLNGKSLRLGKFELSAPTPGVLFSQLAFTLIDTSMAALTLYVLLPGARPDFLTFLPVFAAASMAGVLSHVPGGVGVFEIIIIAALPKGVPLDQIAAALLLYRLIYYLIPFALALAFVAINEARFAGGFITRLFGDVSEPLRPVMKAASGVAPTLIGLAVFGIGSYLVLIALMPSVRPDEIDPDDLLASILLEGGALLSAVLGVLLVILSQGLVRRISGAYWLTLAALAVASGAALMNKLDLDSVLLLLTTAIVLWPFRSLFNRSAKLTRSVLSPGWFALAGGIAVSAATVFFFMHEATPYSTDLWTDFSSIANTSRALRAGLAGSSFFLFVTVWLAIQPATFHTRPPDQSALQKARAIIDQQNDPKACLALTGDKELFFNDSEDAFIMYAVQGNKWIAYSDPVGPRDSIEPLVWSFWEEAYDNGAHPVMFEVSKAYLSLWIEMGFSLHKIGEEAEILLRDFTLAGSKFKSMRSAHNKALKDGFELSINEAPHDATLIAQLKSISDAWIADKIGGEKGFSLGRFDPDYLQNFPIATIKHHGQIVAFANILRPGDGSRVSIDLMRYPPEQANGVMEFLFIELIEYSRRTGAAEFSLSLAPLAGLQVRKGARLWNRFGAIMYRHGRSFYNFEGLRAFKQKFHPEWQPRFVAVPPGVSPISALKDVTLVISGGAGKLFWK